ncbi:hypothetical protein O3G_MSEX005808 [Manduca sexta]|uniref:Fucosyltransferase n=2 Tax=Manduca sexta TaxID=7130 RepID=A0A922CJB5_MANSE|nr:hypothetical protein O3G_MSEX005808 [Manduca sexta]
MNSKDDYVKITSQNPVIIWWTMSFPGTSETRNCPGDIKCDIYSDRNLSKKFNVDAYLFYGSEIKFDNLPLPRNPKDTVWGLYHEESPRNVEELMSEDILKLFNFSSTYSRYSDVPYPLQHLETFQDITSKKYFAETSVKNKLLNDIAPVMYLQSDCETSTERDAYVKELMKYIKIDSYGTCVNNKKLPKKFTEDYLNNLNEDNFLKFIARYKFVVAIENGVCEDYVTEKFWRAIKVGTVPIYFGSPSIKDWCPNNKSAILLQDFPTPKILAEHLQKLLNDDKLYEEYLEHKTKQLISNQGLINENKYRPYQLHNMKIVEEFECFVCRRLHNKHNETNIHIVNKLHYNCPKPISALTLQVNPENLWVSSWKEATSRAKELYNKIMT